MPAPVTNDSKPQTVQSPDAPIPAPAANEAPKDVFAQKDALVVLSGNDQAIPLGDFEEAPEILPPEEFRKKKKAALPQDVPSYFALLAAQQKKDLEQKRDNMDARQRTAAAVQKAQKDSNLATDNKINEQAESQKKSSAKSGFLGIFSKVFSVITFAIGAAMMFVPGLQPLGIALMVTSAIGFATSFPAVMKALGDVFTALLKPLLGEELAKKLGPIFAAVFVAVAQVAVLLAVPNPAQVLSTAASILKTISTATQVTQSAVSGGVGVALGINNLKLADITFALDKLLANTDLFSTQLNNILDALGKEYENMSDSVRKYIQQIDDTPKVSIA